MSLSSILAIAFAPIVHAAGGSDLILYDDFDASTSVDRARAWEPDVAGRGYVGIQDQRLVLDTTRADFLIDVAYHARLRAPALSPRLREPGERFRVSWDMQLLAAGAGSLAGVRIGESQEGSLQVGIGPLGERDIPAGGVLGAFSWAVGGDAASRPYHFDLEIEQLGGTRGLDVRVAVYEQDRRLDARPASYRRLSSPVWSNRLRMASPWSGSVPPAVSFFVGRAFGSESPVADSSLQAAALIDNVYSSVRADLDERQRLEPKGFPIGFWATGMPSLHDLGVTDVQLWADSGFSMVYGPWLRCDHGDCPGAEDMLSFLNAAEERGLQVVLRDTRFLCPFSQEGVISHPELFARGLSKAIEDYRRHGAVFGYSIADEPYPMPYASGKIELRREHFQAAYECARLARALDPSRHAVINHSPRFQALGPYYEYDGDGGPNQAGLPSGYLDFQEDLLGLHLLSGSSLVSSDAYYQLARPEFNLGWDEYDGYDRGDGLAGWRLFFRTLHQNCSFARAHEQDCWQIIIATTSSNAPDGRAALDELRARESFADDRALDEAVKRALTDAGYPLTYVFDVESEAAVRWQFNASLAFGARGIFYYTFYTPDSSSFEAAAVLPDGSLHPERYDWIRNTNRRFRSRYGDLFLSLELQRVALVGSDFSLPELAFEPDEEITAVQTLGRADGRLIVSRFVGPGSRRYLMIVNNELEQPANASLTLADPNPLVWLIDYGQPRGEIRVDELQGDACGATLWHLLDPGEAVLYRIESSNKAEERPAECSMASRSLVMSDDKTRQLEAGEREAGVGGPRIAPVAPGSGADASVVLPRFDEAEGPNPTQNAAEKGERQTHTVTERETGCSNRCSRSTEFGKTDTDDSAHRERRNTSIVRRQPGSGGAEISRSAVSDIGRSDVPMGTETETVRDHRFLSAPMTTSEVVALENDERKPSRLIGVLLQVLGCGLSGGLGLLLGLLALIRRG